MSQSSESRTTVLLALAMNAVIAAAKLVVGGIAGSSSMLAEGAHSVADTLNEVFLLTALRRSARPADTHHPFGYGAERFFWALLAAVGIFVSGAVFSMYQGVTGLLGSGGGGTAFLPSYLVLAIAFAAEGTSWLRSVRQLRSEARGARHGFLDHLRRSHDPTVKTVFGEDAAALIGVVLAGLGVGLHELTGSPRWDAAGAIAIGILLIYVAFQLGRDNMQALIGEAADPELRAALRDDLLGNAEVDAVVELLTMHLGTDQVLAAARIDLADGLDSAALEAAVPRIEGALQSSHPELTHIFLDARTATSGQRAQAGSGRRTPSA